MQKNGQRLVDEIVISDTCCLISFEKINRLELLNKLCENIYITPEVLEEYEGGDSKIPSFIKIKEVKNRDKIKYLMKIKLHKNKKLHEGEASSIALYDECENPLLFTDDGGAREYATKNNMKILTTLDMLVRAREMNYIKTNKELHEYLDGLISARRHIHVDLINEIKEEDKIENLIENNVIGKQINGMSNEKDLNKREIIIEEREKRIEDVKKDLIKKESELTNKEKKLKCREESFNFIKTNAGLNASQNIALKFSEALQQTSEPEKKEFWHLIWERVPAIVRDAIENVRHKKQITKNH
jgi:predicted nucleic acid-binding protein